MAAAKNRFYDIGRIEGLDSSLKAFLKKSGVGWMLRNQDVIELWQQAAGEEIASKTRIRGCRNGTLHVDVFSPALRAEFEQFSGESLLRALQEIAPEIAVHKIKFHLAEKPTSGGVYG
ncbi:MAG: DUF721 domain-containing protein [Planctomycetes bacterium]|nr:DUF721 domain-containing protein [Planctomycetota bacterium]